MGDSCEESTNGGDSKELHDLTRIGMCLIPKTFFDLMMWVFETSSEVDGI